MLDHAVIDRRPVIHVRKGEYRRVSGFVVNRGQLQGGPDALDVFNDFVAERLQGIAINVPHLCLAAHPYPGVDAP